MNAYGTKSKTNVETASCLQTKTKTVSAENRRKTISRRYSLDMLHH